MKIAFLVLGWVLLLVLLHRGCALIESTWFRSLMPTSLAAGDTWKETPYLYGDSAADSWMTGMSEGCGELPEEMSAEVDRALKAPGAYYSVGREKGYIVIPRLGWASLSFFG